MGSASEETVKIMVGEIMQIHWGLQNKETKLRTRKLGTHLMGHNKCALIFLMIIDHDRLGLFAQTSGMWFWYSLHNSVIFV